MIEARVAGAIGPAVAYTLQEARAEDFEALHALRLRAMRPSLENLGRYDEQRSRERLAESFVPAHTQHIVVDGQRVGFLVLRKLSHALRLNHFYIDPPFARRGIGSTVLRGVLAQADELQLPLELVALKGSPANRFYQRHGFVATGEGPWDIDYLRPPQTPTLQLVRRFWQALQARDFAGARALLSDDFSSTWWSSGERYTNADGYIAMQQAYPEGWTILLKELVRLADGRVLALVRVDQPPGVFFATTLCRIDEGRITAVDEYWATVEAPPAWRTLAAVAGLQPCNPQDDPRAQRP